MERERERERLYIYVIRCHSAGISHDFPEKWVEMAISAAVNMFFLLGMDPKSNAAGCHRFWLLMFSILNDICVPKVDPYPQCQDLHAFPWIQLRYLSRVIKLRRENIPIVLDYLRPIILD